MGNLCLVSSRHARNTARVRETRAAHQAKHQASEAGTAKILRTQEQSNWGGGQPTTRRAIHPRDEESHLDRQPRTGPQERHRRAADVRRLRASQQILPKGSLSPAKNVSTPTRVSARV